jgi:hypothetical protein
MKNEGGESRGELKKRRREESYGYVRRKWKDETKIKRLKRIYHKRKAPIR